MEWLIARVGFRAAWGIALAVLLGGLFSGYVLWNKVGNWWDNRKIDRVTEQRDTARAERDVARADAATGEKTTAASSAARKQNDDALPRVRAATAARVDRTGADAEQLRRDEAEAVADYAAAASGLRGKGTR